MQIASVPKLMQKTPSRRIAIKMGPNTVINRKDFFLTLVKYSRCIMSPILLIYFNGFGLINLVYFIDKDVVHRRNNFIN